MPKTLDKTATHEEGAEPVSTNFSAFVSYPHEDQYVARCLRDALISLDKPRVDVFFDVASIDAGQEIGDFISAAIDRANWFIGLGTDISRPNFDWCGLELGMFLANKSLKGVIKSSPICCLFTGVVPSLFASRVQVPIVPIREDQGKDLDSELCAVDAAPLFKMLCDFAKDYRTYYELPDAEAIVGAHEAWAREKAYEITDAFIMSLRSRVKDIWYPQKRIEIRCPPGNFWDAPVRGIPSSSTVQVDIPVYALFRVGAPVGRTSGEFTWSDFIAMAARAMGGPHLETIINQVVCSVLPNQDDAMNDLTFIAPNQTRYRVILTRHILYRDGRRDFVINFIETLSVAPSGDENTTILTAGIMLASRFRFLFLEKGSEYSLNQISACSSDRLRIKVQMLVREWRKITVDAADHKVSDRRSMIKLLHHDDEVGELYDKWWAWVSEFEQKANAFILAPTDDNKTAFLDVYSRVQSSTEWVNRRFIALALEAYERELDES